MQPRGLMGGERYQHLHWWLEILWELFRQEPMAPLNVTAVSSRHHVLCCVRYCTDIPSTEDLQNAATHMKHLVPGLTVEAWGKATPDSCSPKYQVIFCVSACPL